MVKTLERAFAEVATLPESTQEEIGRELLAHVENLRKLKADIAQGVRELDAGEGRKLDIEQFIAQMHQGHAKR